MITQNKANITWGTMRAIILAGVIGVAIFAGIKGHCHTVDIEPPSSYRENHAWEAKERSNKEAYEKVQKHLEANRNMTQEERDARDNDPDKDRNEPSGRDYSESVDYEANHCA